MSPTLKKILIVGGAAVAGYVVYVKVIKKTTTPEQAAIDAAAAQSSSIAAAAAARGLIVAPATVTRTASVSESATSSRKALGLGSLGVSESLGSLGGKR